MLLVTVGTGYDCGSNLHRDHGEGRAKSAACRPSNNRSSRTWRYVHDYATSFVPSYRNGIPNNTISVNASKPNSSAFVGRRIATMLLVRLKQLL